MNGNARVFVVQEPLMQDRATGDLVAKFDLAPLKRYGRLEYLFRWSEPSRMTTEEMISHLRVKLRDFGEHDIILLVGAPICMALATAVAMQKTNGRARLLAHSKERRDHILHECDLDCQPTLKERTS